jgi:hypothetical protein
VIYFDSQYNLSTDSPFADLLIPLETIHKSIRKLVYWKKKINVLLWGNCFLFYIVNGTKL